MIDTQRATVIWSFSAINQGQLSNEEEGRKMCLPDDIQAKLSKLKESVELPVDFNGFDSTREPAAEEETYHRRRKTFSTGVVSIVAYLIGVPHAYSGEIEQ